MKYIQSIESTGALALIIPIQSKNLAYFLDICHGFIIPGGSDIDPSLYGQEKHGSRECDIEYDIWILEVIGKLIQKNKPILGICKGMQLLNVAYGGTLTQNIAENHFHSQEKYIEEYVDSINISPYSFLSEIFGDTTSVNSAHHQAVEIPGEKIRISAQSLHDNTIEAIEHLSAPHYGVQWHPECLYKHTQLFHWFVDQCQA